MITSFVREADLHKNSSSLLNLPADLFKNMELKLVAGQKISLEFENQILQHFSKKNVNVSIETKINDRRKFEIFSSSKLLFFPSAFEGFGYPPIEALYKGCMVICNNLANFRETLGDAPHYTDCSDHV